MKSIKNYSKHCFVVLLHFFTSLAIAVTLAQILFGLFSDPNEEPSSGYALLSMFLTLPVSFFYAKLFLFVIGKRKFRHLFTPPAFLYGFLMIPILVFTPLYSIQHSLYSQFKAHTVEFDELEEYTWANLINLKNAYPSTGPVGHYRSITTEDGEEKINDYYTVPLLPYSYFQDQKSELPELQFFIACGQKRSDCDPLYEEYYTSESITLYKPFLTGQHPYSAAAANTQAKNGIAKKFYVFDHVKDVKTFMFWNDFWLYVPPFVVLMFGLIGILVTGAYKEENQ